MVYPDRRASLVHRGRRVCKVMLGRRDQQALMAQPAYKARSDHRVLKVKPGYRESQALMERPGRKDLLVQMVCLGRWAILVHRDS